MTPLFLRQLSPERAFERVYRAHVQDVYRYALMVLRNTDDAEEVAQTTFLKAFRAFQRGEKPRNPRAWLIAIAHNTCRTRLRDAKRRPQEVALEEQLVGSAAHDDGDGDILDTRELVRAFGALTFNQRAALVMRELEGRSYAEIADVLELSPSAVETVLFRARRALREQLEGALSCGDAELALSRDLDGRLDDDERVQLRAHLRSCRECSGLARRQRARRAALRSLGPLHLPASLASWGGAATGTGIAVKVAAVIAAGAAAVGATQGIPDALADRVTRDAEPRPAVATIAVRTPTPAAAAQHPATLATRVAAAEKTRVQKRTKHAGTATIASPTPAAPKPTAAATPTAGGAGSSDPTSTVAAVPVPNAPVPVPNAPVPVPEAPLEVPEVPTPELPATPTLPVEVPEPPPLPPLPPLP